MAFHTVLHREMVALQARLESLYASEILAEEELHVLEDIIADYLEATLVPGEEVEGADGPVSRMLALSSRMPSDAAFGRQLRRKFAHTAAK
jgi:hypothetical protein